ncbi:TetR/AcrR family transcriptional regulator [Leucobacter komagatae]|uniref:TetR/AcrR family transcriptional regulator n=1 Tax=Leucobacter komagatae TaxID=55969 RepID=UPI000696C7DB|nr:TetR/AcrR family transcriptional regulator [Leucobacter komagatae]
MRASSRTDILDAAMRVVNAPGGHDLTYDSVARESGLTKAGLMYHFATKEALMIAVIEHVIARWQRELLAELETPFEQSTLADRVRAFTVFAGSGGVTPGEFTVFAEAVRRPALAAPWQRTITEWFTFGSEPATAPLMLAALAANGLWVAESTGILTVSDARRAELLESLAALCAPTP